MCKLKFYIDNSKIKPILEKFGVRFYLRQPSISPKMYFENLAQLRSADIIIISSDLCVAASSFEIGYVHALRTFNDAGKNIGLVISYSFYDRDISTNPLRYSINYHCNSIKSLVTTIDTVLNEKNIRRINCLRS